MTEADASPARTEPTLDSTTRVDPSDELATTTLLRGAIGPVNTDYYLNVFTRFDANDRAGPSWNTAAALVTLSWMLYRKMWNAALAYTGLVLGVALMVFGIGKLVFHYEPEVQWALSGLYLLLVILLPGLFGNALLFRQYRSSMAGAISATQSITEAAALLLSRAPTRRRLIVVAAVQALALAVLLALVAWARALDGMPTPLGLSAATAPLPAPAASGNLAVGKAQEVAAAPASAPATTASGPAVPASSMAPAASAPAVATPAAATINAAPASAPSATASALRTTAVAATAAASAPAALASAPTAKASAPAPAATKSPSPPAAAPQVAASAATTPPVARKVTPPSAAPTAKPMPTAQEKVEAARLAPQASVQKNNKVAEPPVARAPAAKVAPRAAARAEGALPSGDAVGTPPGQYGINVGVFADDNNARNAFVKLSDAGLPAYTQVLQGKKGKLTRVRVGPFSALVEAERTAERIRALGLDALIFQQPQQR